MKTRKHTKTKKEDATPKLVVLQSILKQVGLTVEDLLREQPEIEFNLEIPEFDIEELLADTKFTPNLRIPRDAGHDSMLMPDSVSPSSRTPFHADGGQHSIVMSDT